VSNPCICTQCEMLHRLASEMSCTTTPRAAPCRHSMSSEHTELQPTSNLCHSNKYRNNNCTGPPSCSKTPMLATFMLHPNELLRVYAQLFIYFAIAAVAVDSSILLRRHPLHGVHSVCLQILMGLCRQCGSWSVAGHNHRKVIGQDPICVS